MADEIESVEGLTLLERILALEVVVQTHLATSGANIAALAAGLAGVADAVERDRPTREDEVVGRVFDHALIVLKGAARRQKRLDEMMAKEDPEGARLAAEQAEIDKELRT